MSIFAYLLPDDWPDRVTGHAALFLSAAAVTALAAASGGLEIAVRLGQLDDAGAALAQLALDVLTTP